MLQPAWNKHFDRFTLTTQNHAINYYALKGLPAVAFSVYALKCLTVLGLRDSIV